MFSIVHLSNHFDVEYVKKYLEKLGCAEVKFVSSCVTFIFQATEGKPIKVMGNVLTMMERTDDEFTKLLQNTDAHSTDYVTKYVHVCIVVCKYKIMVTWYKSITLRILLFAGT